MPLSDVVHFIEQLADEAGINYTVIGGVAVSAFGEPRATKDADVVIMIDPSDVDGFLTQVESLGLRIPNRNKVRSKLENGRPAKIAFDKKFSVDFRIAQYTIDFEAIRRTQSVEMPQLGVTLNISSPEDIVVYKLARFEDIDKRDIDMVIAHNTIDWDYVQTQAEILAEEAVMPKILDRLQTIRP